MGAPTGAILGAPTVHTITVDDEETTTTDPGTVSPPADGPIVVRPSCACSGSALNSPWLLCGLAVLLRRRRR